LIQPDSVNTPTTERRIEAAAVSRLFAMRDTIAPNTPTTIITALPLFIISHQ
jgi:hypothetical protein